MNQGVKMMVLTLLATVLAGPVAVPAQQLSVEDVMVRVLLDNSVASDIKRENISILLATSEGKARLAEILKSQANIETRKLICQEISNYNPGGMFSNASVLPEMFIEPLFICLYSGDADLSDSAATALAYCFGDGVLRRLAGTAVSGDQQQQYRLAAIVAIERISGRESLLTLAELLSDKDTVVRDRALDAICRRLVIDKSGFDVTYFIQTELPNLRWMSDKDFLLHQARRLSQNNKLLNIEIANTRQQVLYWQGKFLRAETDRFNSLTPENKLAMLISSLDPGQDKPVRQWAASQMLSWGNSATARDGVVGEGLVRLLGEHIADSEDFVRSSVAEAMGVFGYTTETAQLVQKLLEQLQIEKSLSCQRSMLNTLGQLQFTPALEQCIMMWEGSDSDEISAAAVSAAGKISAKIAAEESNRIDMLVRSIKNNFARCNGRASLKVAVYQAIRRVIETQRWRQLAASSFDAIISAGLKDELADVRSMSVHSYVSLHGPIAVDDLLEIGMLDDNEPTVRFAILTAIDGNSSPEYLQNLKKRFLVESSSDVKARLQETIRKILNGMAAEDVYLWAETLTSEQESVRSLKTLVASILVDKVAAMKTASELVAPKYEIFILSCNVDDYLKKSQFEQAGRTIVDLLNYGLTAEQRLVICKKLFEVLFDANVDLEIRQKIVDLSQVVIPGLFGKYPDTLDLFANKYDAYSDTDLASTIFKARLLRQYVISAESVIQTKQLESWTARKKTLMLKLVDKALADTTTIDQSIITVLKGLDSRFSSLSSGPDADLAGQRAILLLIKQSEQP